MNELHDLLDTAIWRDLSRGGHWNEGDQSSRSSVGFTPPSTSSVGEPTPAGADNDGSANSIGHQDEDVNSSNDDKAPKVKLASAIEDVVSSHLQAMGPLTTWASVEALAKDHIARLARRETPSHKGLESACDDINGYPIQDDVGLSCQEISIQSPDNLRRDGRSPNGWDLSGKSVDISLRILTRGSSHRSLPRNINRVDKKRGVSRRRPPPSLDGNSDVQSLRRGRPSERGFSCARCTIAKKRCIGNENCCEACSKSQIYRQLCIRADFKESRILLHDLYKTRIQTLLNNVVEYTSPSPELEPLKITISNGFDSQLDIELQHYVASDENALTHTIFRGLEAGMIYPTARSTSFALRPGTLTAAKIDQYCERMACDMILKESASSTQNRLLNHVILFAVTQINREDVRDRIEGLDMVRLALRFWATQAIFFAYPWRIEKGGNRIGMFPLQLPGYWNGITLLPRLVNQELDRAFETRMDELEKQTLEKLQAAIFKRHRDYWCSIFLSSFILLHSLERDTWNMSAWDYETQSRGAAAWPLRKSPSEYCDQNKHIASIIATHFKIVNQGSSPLKQNWNRPLNQQLLNDSILARKFILSIQSDFHDPTSRYKAELRRRKGFSRNDSQSLDYTYTMMLFEE